ncbi:hypothetical protein GCM10023319_13910 [Nocardia iowensis]|uniref:Shikimate kinase n=1 Tax=Nocardia iowensis TaxID=204891 RepID=A0ABX8RI71_NOCIO|nr:shikimate kinase [Nocardia iowensis]
MIVQTDPRAPRVVLVGPPGAGKSTIGRKLAKELGVELYDTDAGIERETGRTIPEIFATDGEPEFRRIEEQVVRRAILAERGVVSLGGGAVLSKETRALLRNRTVVYLEISVGEGLRRTGASTNRPLLNGADPAAKYRELMRKRRPLYREVATVRVRTDGRSPGRVVKMVLAKLGLEPVDPGTGTDTDNTDLPETTTPPSTAAESTGTPRAGSRSRARRRARARAAARRAAEQEQAAGATEQTTSAPSGKSAANANGRSWRTRRPAAADNDTGEVPTTSAGDAGAAQPAEDASSTGRSWRTRRSAAPDDTGAANQSDGTEESSPSARSSGRARRARARRARVRARKNQEATTESEQS